MLVADEAVSALDVSVQARVLALFEELRGRLNLAMLFTHDLRVASQICDHLVVMSQGRVVESEPAHRVFAAPEHACTRAVRRGARAGLRVRRRLTLPGLRPRRRRRAAPA